MRLCRVGSQIREDIVDAVKRLAPKAVTNYSNGGEVESTEFTGWSRMAMQINSFQVRSVQKPNVGEEVPASVKGEVRFNLRRYSGAVRQEWDSLREHDVVFLLTIRFPRAAPGQAPVGEQEQGEAGKKPARRLGDDVSDADFAAKNGIIYVRGAEVYALTDERGNLMNDPFADRSKPQVPAGDFRTLKVRLDAAQYHQDMMRTADGGEDVYVTTR